MSLLSVAALAFLLDVAVSFRVKPKRAQGKRKQGEVAATFPFGSPGTADPALTNPRRSDGCFPGARFWTVKKQWFGVEADLATTVTGIWPLNFRHPKMDGIELGLKRDVIVRNPCSDNTPNLPSGLPKIIHDIELYATPAQTINDRLFNISNYALPQSMLYERAEVEATLKNSGWTVAGTGIDSGGSDGYVGRKVSHLIWQPSTRECVLTFQGTASTEDWKANANTKKVEFCGVSSRVHSGFRDSLRLMMRNSDWQTNVRAKLSSCSAVYVTGHSLGGAMAELFSACIAQAPASGTSGYEEDYKYMSWTH